MELRLQVHAVIEEYIVVAKKARAPVMHVPFAGQQDTSHKVRNQIEYNDYLNSYPYSEGDFLTFSQTDIEHLSQIHYIVRLDTNFEGVTWDRYGGPKCLHLVQCDIPRGGVSLTPWVRWDNRTGYRLITVAEYDKFIKENHDNIRDSCRKIAGYKD